MRGVTTKTNRVFLVSDGWKLWYGWHVHDSQIALSSRVQVFFLQLLAQAFSGYFASRKKEKMRYIFGPVPSRRLGRSLGVDLVPFKTCSYDCIYCQLGRTTNKTMKREEWVPIDEVMAELEKKLSTNPDYITLSGSGEPTLYSRLDELIERIHAITDVPVAVLTNGSLLWQPELRAQLLNAELVIPSLDAGDETMFQVINRPCTGISFEKMLQGLIDFRREYQGLYWLEVFLLAGHNVTSADLQKIVDCTKRINPDLVQLNTATRPTTEEFAQLVDRADLERIAQRFSPPAEVIADYHGVHQQSDFESQQTTVLEMIRRRPCSIEDIAAGLSIHRNQVVKYVENLVELEKVEIKKVKNQPYYFGRVG